MSENSKIHFSIGPVQGFVAQARRTRDLWSGSFLLSYLAGCAIKCVQDNNGEIEVPYVKGDRLLVYINTPKDDGNSPMIGTLPNRFEASAPNPDGVAEEAAIAVRKAWKKIADAVYDRYVKNIVDYGAGTKDIWDRQVKSFWEITWTVGPDIASMNYRKNWRSHLPPEEGGDHCTIMGDWQELSGFIRSKDKGSRGKQDLFWRQLREGTGSTDIREGERLCSIALIKRMFPNPVVSKKAIGWKVDAVTWPSTAYVAAIPWLMLTSEKFPELCERYARDVNNAALNVSRKGISDKIGISSNAMTASFLNLDGNFYFINAIDNCDRTPLSGTPSEGMCKDEPLEVLQARDNLKGKLRALATNAGSSPSAFYGMLIMDGDRMGELIRKKGALVSSSLGKFTESVHNTIKKYKGVTIYAGGDDVLAMLPVETAIRCSLELSNIYRDSFKNIPDLKADISAGLVFAQYRIPLGAVLDEAHDILDDVAKDQNGRGSLAISILKPSGKNCQWTATWDNLMVSEGKSILDDLLTAVKGDKQFSTSFFYNLKDIFTALSGDISERPGIYVHLIKGIDPVGLLAAEYIMSREGEVTREDAKKHMRSLLKLCYRSNRDENGNALPPNEKCLSTDGVMLLKFLSQDGAEVE